MSASGREGVREGGRGAGGSVSGMFIHSTLASSINCTIQRPGNEATRSGRTYIYTPLSFSLQFETFYIQKHSGRKLAWLHHMSIGRSGRSPTPQHLVM